MRSLRRALEKPRFKIATLITLSILFVLTLSLFVYNLRFSGKIYPNIYVAGVNIGGQNPNEAAITLSQRIITLEKLKLVSDSKSYEITAKEISLNYDYLESAKRAFNLTRSGNIILDLWTEISLLTSSKKIGLATKFNNAALDKKISVVSDQISTPSIPPSLKLTNGKIVVSKGNQGTKVDTALLRASIGYTFALAESKEIIVPIETIGLVLSDDEAANYKSRGEKFVGKSLTLKFEFENYNFSTPDLIKLVDPKDGLSANEIVKNIEDISKKIDRAPQNPKFSFESGKVLEFQPALDGAIVKQEELGKKFAESLNLLETTDTKTLTLEVPVTRTPPEITTDKVNNLGIKELIGRGTSTFYHSIPSRVHNVVLAASRINGTLVKPGETFSFNDALGDVSQFTGYQQAYIISEGKTVLGDGGGVCQVSTTLFRALLNAGLPITDRTAHAYRVGYYEQNSPPGFDATVYGPSPDLKFKNDTPAYILIEATADPKRYSLIFELYGTSDGRVATTSKPTVTDIVPAPPDIYQDDPTLSAGTIKQVDFKAVGAKVTFNYLVSRRGETLIKKTFISNYRPWQAVYLRGTGPAR